ncbi:Protein Y48G1C.6 [Aphelenchoides avenae]|nr:Protein Y48G1C.6 [Aphelenchus avenae]
MSDPSPRLFANEVELIVDSIVRHGVSREGDRLPIRQALCDIFLGGVPAHDIPPNGLLDKDELNALVNVSKIALKRMYKRFKTAIRNQNDDESIEAPIPTKRRSFANDAKLHAVEMAKSRKISEVASHFGVHSKTVRDWTKRAQKLNEACESGSSKRKRLAGGGRPVKCKELDDEVIRWVREQQEKKRRVTRRTIREYAKRYLDRMDMAKGEITLKCSEGWLERFIVRHNLPCGRKITTDQQEVLAANENLVEA